MRQRTLSIRLRREAEKDLKERRSELNQLDKRLRQKEETLDLQV